MKQSLKGSIGVESSAASKDVVSRAIHFQNPPRLPLTMSISGATHAVHGRKLADLLARYPDDFAWAGWRISDDGPDEPGTHTDEWGCVWQKLQAGIGGQCVEHPLENWDDFSSYDAPSPLTSDRWERVGEEVSGARAADKYLLGGGGYLFERILALRGFENTLMDLASDRMEMNQLIEVVGAYVDETIRKAREYHVDGMIFGDNWGHQGGLFVSPETWWRRFLPVYRRWFKAAHACGVNVHFHSDGNVTDLLPDFVEMGADELNLQVGVLDVDRTAALCRDRVCIRGEPDRQQVLPHTRPEEVRAYVKDLVQAFHTPRGGFIMSVKIQHDTPWENIVALFEALEPYL